MTDRRWPLQRYREGARAVAAFTPAIVGACTLVAFDAWMRQAPRATR